MRRDERFEIVHTDAGHHARFRASNGRIVWTTEVYRRRGKAVRAVELICGVNVYRSPFSDHPEIEWGGSEWMTEVRDVDEREARP
jgi:uncharacterized protein YegP (UPF0339 family)